MSAVLQEIITLLTSGLTQMATGIGGGLKALVEAIFLDTSGSTPALSVYGGVVVIFAAISLSIALCSRVFAWVTTLGN